MLTELRIENFKAIEGLTVPLRPLTVLIGPNDSGKSTILQALDVLSRSTERPVAEIFSPNLETVLYQRDTARRLELKVKHANQTEYLVQFRWDGAPRACFEQLLLGTNPSVITTRDNGLSLAKDPHTGESIRYDHWSGERTFVAELAQNPQKCPTYSEVAQELASSLLRLDPERLAEPCPLQVGGTPSLDQRGFGLAALVDYLAAKAPELRNQLEVDLRELVPTLAGVALENVDISKSTMRHRETGKALEFRLAGLHGVNIPAKHTSDGALLATGYLAVAYGSATPRLLIDEPENGLHPHLLGFVVNLLRRMSVGTLGGTARQVILTTHSPILLNFVEPEEVLIVTRNRSGAVRVTPMTETEHFQARFEDFDLGELWYNVGESKLVK